MINKTDKPTIIPNLDKLTRVQLRIFNQIVALTNLLGPTLYCTQEYIAHRLGISRATVNRNLPALVEQGLILKKYRGVKITCLVELREDLYSDIEVRRQLSHILPTFSIIPRHKYFSLLLSLAATFLPGVTQNHTHTQALRFGKQTSAHSLSEIKGQSDRVLYRDSSDPFSCLLLNYSGATGLNQWQTIYGEPQWHFESTSFPTKGHGKVDQQSGPAIIDSVFNESKTMDTNYYEKEETRSPFKYDSSPEEEIKWQDIKKHYSQRSAKNHLNKIHQQMDRVQHEDEETRISNMATLMKQHQDGNPFAGYALKAINNNRNEAL